LSEEKKKKDNADVENENEKDAENTETISEAVLIANEINCLISEKKYNYSDIAILYRSRTSVDKLKHKLDEFNIPYIEQGGIGFYEKPEIIHLINYLTFLNNQKNDVALVGILFSPFFSLSNTELLNIVGTNNYLAAQNQTTL
jgi:ATP-dependent helicase/nuclease subunit A